MSLHRTARTIGKRVVPTTEAASGVWHLGEHELARRANIWPAGDPYFSSVSLLLQDELVDESPLSLTVTANGSAAASTSNPKVGAKGFDFTTTSDYISVPNASGEFDFPGDFTVELWANFSAIGNTLISSETSSGPWGLAFDGVGGTPGRLGWIRNNIAWEMLSASAVTVATGEWHHYAITRVGSTLRLFFDGAIVGSGTKTTSYSGGTSIATGRRPGDAAAGVPRFAGTMDAIRITKGVGRYSAAFTPQTTPFGH